MPRVSKNPVYPNHKTYRGYYPNELWYRFKAVARELCDYRQKGGVVLNTFLVEALRLWCEYIESEHDVRWDSESRSFIAIKRDSDAVSS